MSFSKQIGIICVAVTCGVAMFVGILTVTALFTSLSGSDYWWVGGFIVSIPAALVCAERVNRALLSWAVGRSRTPWNLRSTIRPLCSMAMSPEACDDARMADVHSKKTRSYNMSQIRGKDTKPELIVRSMVHRMGYRFRLHVKHLPGKPDLVLPRHEKVIFVHGCYWHMHHCRYGRVVPKTNTEFWQNKRQGNVDRDRRNLRKLRREGWKVLVLWECWTRDEERLYSRLAKFLDE